MNKKYIDMRENGFTTIQIPLPQTLLEETVNSYRIFDKNTSMKDKAKTDFRENENSRVSYGHRDKSDDEGFDNKSYFHFNPIVIEKNFLPNNQLYQTFINNINKIYEIVEPILIALTKEFENDNIIQKDKFLNAKGKPTPTIRIINYKPKANNKTLAKQHADRGILTLTLYETDDGLSFIHNDIETDIKYQENTSKVFPSGRWNEFAIEKLIPLQHKVTNKGYNKERTSIVLFLNPRLDE